MWLVGGGSASSKRAFRYGVRSGAWCCWRLGGALVSSGRGCVSVLFVLPEILSLTFCFSFASLGHSLDHASCSPPHVHLGFGASQDDDLCPVAEQRAQRSVRPQELAT